MSPTRRRIATLLCVVIPACVSTQDDGAAVIQHWLTCEECVNGELAAVRALGAAAIPPLSQAVLGPPPEAIANMRRSSLASWHRAQRYSLTLSPGERALRPLGDSAAFMTRDESAFRSVYQVRAAHALHVIDPVRARSILEQRLRQNDSLPVKFFRPDVRAAVDSLAHAP